MFSRSEFTYDAERDVYVCPNGKLLRTSGTIHDGRVMRAPFKKIARDINEDARNHARSLKGTPEFERSSNARKKVEMRFAHLRSSMALSGCAFAVSPAPATSFISPPNLKTMALRLLGPPTRGARGAIA